MFTLPTFLPSKTLNVYLLLRGVGRESNDDKYGPQRERVGMYEVGEKEP